MTATTRWFGVSLLACCALTAVWGWGNAGAAAPADVPKGAKANSSDIVRSLQKERVAALESIRDLVIRLHQQGTTTGAELQRVEAEVLEARLELSESADERIAICAQLVKAAEASAELAERMRTQGVAPQSDFIRARIGVLDAKIRLEKEKAASENK